jgi:SAM-dependent methyltransferase
MSVRPNRRDVIACGLAAGALTLLPAQLAAQPRPLDVPYVPTPEHVVETMLRLVKPTKEDYLGCGDGRIVITAAQKYGVRGFGVDLNPERIKEARANALKAGVTGLVEFVEGDLFKTDFKKATVLTMYLLPSVNMRLRPQVLQMKPGTRVVSHAFHMEDWTADVTEKLDFRTVYHWVVPAPVGGRWAGTIGGAKAEVLLDQKFQELGGTATIDGKPARITSGKITGEEVVLELTLADGKAQRVAAHWKAAALSGNGVQLRKQ